MKIFRLILILVLGLQVGFGADAELNFLADLFNSIIKRLFSKSVDLI